SDVEYRPRPAMTNPKTVQMNHSGRAAAAKSTPAPASAGPATEPHRATPILTPTCRLVDAIADAAPARSVGMPLTAALVTGALTIEKPIPNTAKMTSMCQTGVVALSRVSSSAAIAINAPEISSDGRLPNRPTMRP